MISIHIVILILCVGFVQNKDKTNNSIDISDRNSDIYLNSLQLIAKYGYIPQQYTVITKDGYLVTLFRIPKNGPPVLLVHGIGDSSDSWMVLGPAKSTAFLLSDSGYDVWLYNARGNKYSKGHINNLTKRQYWDFSYEEMGTQDLPAIVDHILSTTSQQKLSYIGFSQGTTIFMVMCSTKPEYNEKIKEAIFLAPVATITYTKYTFIDIVSQNLDLVRTFLDGNGVYDVFSNNALKNLYHAQVCRDGVPEQVLCALEFFISYGIRNISNLLPERLPILASHIPAGISTKTFVHYIQSYISRKFQKFDYGPKTNMNRYSSSTPPMYDLSLIKVPLHLFVSESDWFSTIEDVEELRKKLNSIVQYVVYNKSLDFTHLEFVYGSRINSFVNEPVMNILSGYSCKLKVAVTASMVDIANGECVMFLNSVPIDYACPSRQQIKLLDMSGPVSRAGALFKLPLYTQFNVENTLLCTDNERGYLQWLMVNRLFVFKPSTFVTLTDNYRF